MSDARQFLLVHLNRRTKGPGTITALTSEGAAAHTAKSSVFALSET